MKIRKSFHFCLRPTKKQQTLLNGQLNECRWLYNELLAQRKLAFEDIEISLSKYQQMMLLPFLKEERPSLNSVHSQVLQNVVDRLDKGFQAFFRRCKEGKEPGFPRFRGEHRYSSFCYPQSGFSFMDGELKLSKMGSIRVKMHRPLEGDIKTCTLKRDASGNWSVSLSCELDAKPKTPKEESIGIDVGLENFATLSNGQVIGNPRFFKKSEKILAKTQRKLSRLEKGTPERKKQGKIVAKTHEKIRNQRKDFCHKISKGIINQYQYICVEDLSIKEMIEGPYYAKSIADVSWNQFLRFLSYKAEDAGRQIRFVNPAYTTQDCYKSCSCCGYAVSRDLNAAQNILALGLDGLGKTPGSLRL